jgi:hypothetical protein
VVQDCWKSQNDYDDFQWTSGVGGTWHLSLQSADYICGDPVDQFSDNTISYFFDDMSWEYSHPEDGFSCPSYADIVDPYTDPNDSGAFVWHAQTKVAVDTGGEGEVGTREAYLVRASAAEIGYFYTGTIPLPPQSLQINDHVLINTAMISLLLSLVLSWPRANPFSAAQALTMTLGQSPALMARRKALPSSATISSAMALSPAHETLQKLLRIDGREDSVKRIVTGNAVGQFQKSSEPVGFGFAKDLHVFKTIGHTQ